MICIGSIPRLRWRRMVVPGTRARRLACIYCPPAILRWSVEFETETCYQYWPSVFSNDILVNIDANQGDALLGAYFGYTGSILSEGSSFRYPSWYIHGLSEVFSASSITRDTVIIGGFSPGRVQDLRTYPLIPMKVFLGLRAEDPQLASASAQRQYAAQSW